MVNILIIDELEMVGEGIKNILSEEDTFNVDLVVCNDTAGQIIQKKHYDIYLIDLELKNKKAMCLAEEVQLYQPDAKVLVCTSQEIAPLFNYIIDIGIHGIISKSFSKQELIQAIWLAVNNKAVLPIDLISQLRRTENEIKLENGKSVTFSETEEKILLMLAKGKTNSELADELYMSQRNIERYLTKIFKKIRVNCRAKAIAQGRELGVIPKEFV